MRKVKAHATPESVLAGIITADDRAGNDLSDAACKLVVLEHRAPPNIREARLTAISDNVWTLTRPGCLGVGVQLRESAALPTTRAHVCRQRLAAHLPALSTSRERDARQVPRRSRRQSARHGATAPA